jgi:LmbE family N-acetylglucosaminyl deacetylase
MKQKALCVVAHPDDCIIFARPFIQWFNNFEWTILYLTYSETDSRGKEVLEYWSRRGITVKFLGYRDNYRDMSTGKLSFDSATAFKQIVEEAEKHDLLLTHNKDGDYGHIHHKFVNICVTSVLKPKIYFARQQESNYVCELNEDINLEEIPLHKDIVSQFQNLNSGRYFLSDQSKGLVYGIT